VVRRVSSQVSGVKLRTVNLTGGRSLNEARKYGIRATPTTVILRPDGSVFTKVRGAVPGDQLASQVERAKG
jgi:hypothetical protein